jgi:hypothetical protein
MAVLGLAAIDPIGLAIMPLLLVQKHGIRKSSLFLFGGFVSLIILGVAFSKGLGKLILNIEKNNGWLLTMVELIAALTLLIIAITTLIQMKKGKAPSEPSARMLKWLNFSDWKLFSFGLALVAVQSLFDIVFVVAMIRIGQLKVSLIDIVLAVFTYAFFALFFQMIIVFIYSLTPDQQKQMILKKVRHLIDAYTRQAIIVISLALSGVLLLLAS